MQITKYKWDLNAKEPFFLLDDGTKMKLFDQNINFLLGEKKCVGFIKDGKKHECPHSRSIEYGEKCNECKINDDFFLCMQCDGECINKKQRRGCETNNYYIYLAAFDSLLKIGISYEHRFLERWVEQGADFAAKIAYLKDGSEARKLEQKISKELNIIDRIKGEKKQDIIFGNPNVAATNIKNAVEKLKLNGFSVKPLIHDLRNFYRLQNILSYPKKMQIENKTQIKGRFAAAKGNVLVLENENGFFSFNSHSLVGREIDINI